MANPGQPQFPRVQEAGSISPLDLPEMEKLLTKVEGKDDKALNLSKSFSEALDLEKNGHSLPFKVISEGHREASLPGSLSRASSRRASSVATTSFAQDQEVPKDYLILAIASCFCPVWPLNLIPLIFSIMVSASLCSGAGAGPWGWQACPQAGMPGRMQRKESQELGSHGKILAQLPTPPSRETRG
ncbi:Tumor suppressor candidate 5-like protein [Sciurus carolinensis]|uniref:Tumor suppressor candidate 5-like protein n=1 Tax=Sciurus carolinensis TaxID=30640 RepID=A0AA41T7E1_SCICA|nr:Tumor suppressor candidate 5-like protein [Sciurus carolinensis]